MPTKNDGRPIGIPVIGEGSQPGADGDENFDFMESPGLMHTYDTPILPEPEEVKDLTIAKNMLTELLSAIQNYQSGDPAIAFDISDMDAANVNLINQIFNEGEVSVLYEGNSSVQIQESVLTGIWRICINGKFGTATRDIIEVADIPSIVREKTFANSTLIDKNLNNLSSDIANGAQNAPSILIELSEKMKSWKKGNLPHVINLTLLPLSPEDINLLGERLGVGPITILSRGYGNCRIGSTEKKNIWWVKYFNSEDKLILNTIEVIDVPEVAIAAPEDLADSAKRLREILQVYDVDIAA